MLGCGPVPSLGWNHQAECCKNPSSGAEPTRLHTSPGQGALSQFQTKKTDCTLSPCPDGDLLTLFLLLPSTGTQAKGFIAVYLPVLYDRTGASGISDSCLLFSEAVYRY